MRIGSHAAISARSTCFRTIPIPNDHCKILSSILIVSLQNTTAQIRSITSIMRKVRGPPCAKIPVIATKTATPTATQIIVYPICVCSYLVTEVRLAPGHPATAEISPGTLLNFPAVDVRDQKCVRPAAWLLCNPRRTFPSERRDYRCNVMPLLPAFSDQQANPTACRRDASQ